MRRLSAHNRVLAEDPPPEFFLASYFIGHEWWKPPERGGRGAGDNPELPQSDLPEFEP